MKLTGDDIREFATIWLDEFHEEINEKEAEASASLLLELYCLLASSFPEESVTQPQK